MTYGWDDGVAVRTLYQEVRGEPLIGQQAVACVLLNRQKDGRWGKSLGEVCLSEYKGVYQFSGWSRGDPNRVPTFHLSDNDPALLALYGVLETVRATTDITNGAMWYHAASMLTKPVWTLGATFCGQWGSQLFYKGIL